MIFHWSLLEKTLIIITIPPVVQLVLVAEPNFVE
jgi:hypothetical protein